MLPFVLVHPFSVISWIRLVFFCLFLRFFFLFLFLCVVFLFSMADDLEGLWNKLSLGGDDEEDNEAFITDQIVDES